MALIFHQNLRAFSGTSVTRNAVLADRLDDIATTTGPILAAAGFSDVRSSGFAGTPRAPGSALRATLESWGHEVVTAGDGAAGLENARERPWDVIVTDLRMPKVSGREFYEALAAEQPLLAQRVVFSTGDTVRGDTLAFLEQQGRPVLHKPFSLSDLRSALASASR